MPRGCVVTFLKGTRLRFPRRNSDGDCLELLLERRSRIVREMDLAFAHHVNHLDAVQRDSCEKKDLKPSIGLTRRLIRRRSCSTLALCAR